MSSTADLVPAERIPFPLLYLTCSSGSQQTVKGQEAEAWEPGKYSTCSLSGGEASVSPDAASLNRFSAKPQPAFCVDVIKARGRGKPVECVLRFAYHLAITQPIKGSGCSSVCFYEGPQ